MKSSSSTSATHQLDQHQHRVHSYHEADSSAHQNQFMSKSPFIVGTDFESIFLSPPVLSRQYSWDDTKDGPASLALFGPNPTSFYSTYDNVLPLFPSMTSSSLANSDTCPSITTDQGDFQLFKQGGGDACSYDLRDHQEPATVKQEYPPYGDENGEHDELNGDGSQELTKGGIVEKQLAQESGPVCFPPTNLTPKAQPRSLPANGKGDSTSVAKSEQHDIYAQEQKQQGFKKEENVFDASSFAALFEPKTGDASKEPAMHRPQPRLGAPSFLHDMGDGMIRTPGPGQTVLPQDAFGDYEDVTHLKLKAPTPQQQPKSPKQEQAQQNLMAILQSQQQQAREHVQKAQQKMQSTKGTQQTKQQQQSSRAQQSTQAQQSSQQAGASQPSNFQTQPAPLNFPSPQVHARPAPAQPKQGTSTTADISVPSPQQPQQQASQPLNPFDIALNQQSQPQVPSTSQPAAPAQTTQPAPSANFQAQPQPIAAFNDGSFFSHQAILNTLAADEMAKKAAANGQNGNGDAHPYGNHFSFTPVQEAKSSSQNTQQYQGAGSSNPSSSLPLASPQYGGNMSPFGDDAMGGSSSVGRKRGKGGASRPSPAANTLGGRRSRNSASNLRSTLAGAAGTTSSDDAEGEYDPMPTGGELNARGTRKRKASQPAAAAIRSSRGRDIAGLDGTDGEDDQMWSAGAAGFLDADDQGVSDDGSFGKPVTAARKRGRKAGASGSRARASATPSSTKAADEPANGASQLAGGLDGTATPSTIGSPGSVNSDLVAAQKPKKQRANNGKARAVKDKNTTPGTGTIPCEYIDPETGKQCPIMFRRPYDQARHMDTVHGVGNGGETKKHSCLTCHKNFSRKDALIRHGRISGHPAV